MSDQGSVASGLGNLVVLRDSFLQPQWISRQLATHAYSVQADINDVDNLEVGQLIEIGDKVRSTGSSCYGHGLEREDTLTNVEYLQFFDITIAVSDLLAAATSATVESAETLVSVDVLANDQTNATDAWFMNASVIGGNGVVSIISSQLIFDPQNAYSHLLEDQSEEVTSTYIFETSGGQTAEGTLTVTVSSSGDAISGITDDDTFDGSWFNDLLHGAEGSDTLNGGTDNESIEGGDLLDGDTGNNTLVGGDGVDVFVFNREAKVYRVTDFEVGTDKIDLSAHLEDVVTVLFDLNGDHYARISCFEDFAFGRLTLDFVQNGDDVEVYALYDGSELGRDEIGLVVTLEGIDVADLSFSDFFI